MMTRARGLLGAVLAVLVVAAAAVPATHEAHGAARATEIRQLYFEFVGQFQNSPPGVTPPTHSHYGYLSHVGGASAFSGSPQDEKTALFTFFAPDATTVRVIADGPLRIVTRVGRVTIYRDQSPDGSFDRPETFRDGTPVLVGAFRQQVVNNTVTGSLTTFHRVRITSTRPFQAGRQRLQLGRVGQRFTIAFNGHGNMPGPPSGFFGGYAVSG
jgi:hypothetical protein